MSDAPPAYSEAPEEDLVAELAKMKTMMEQMRLEKERMEMEAKRKAEEEEMRELKEIQKKLLHEIYSRTVFTRQPSLLGHWNKTLLDPISQRGEVLLFLINGDGQSGFPESVVYNIITNRHIYTVIQNDRDGSVESRALYMFDMPLGKKHTMMVQSCVHLLRRKINIPGLAFGSHSIDDMVSKKKFESVIRLIPGSYHNGPWRQLDGFFGMYFNEDTMEVSEMPPPSL